MEVPEMDEKRNKMDISENAEKFLETLSAIGDFFLSLILMSGVIIFITSFIHKNIFEILFRLIIGTCIILPIALYLWAKWKTKRN